MSENATPPTEVARDGEAVDVSEADAPRSASPSRAPSARKAAPSWLRFVFNAVWFALVPICLAVFFVWALTPPLVFDREGIYGWIQSVVREQSVPVGIMLFTLFEAALVTLKEHLPFAALAMPAQRTDVPPGHLAAFQRASALIGEAEAILDKRGVVESLGEADTESVVAILNDLDAAMDAVPFEPGHFDDTLSKAARIVETKLGRWRKSEGREFAESIIVALVVAMLLRTFMLEAFKIPSGSMIPTLQVGDHIFVNKFSYGPAVPYLNKRIWTSMPPNRGDVMVFIYPENPEQDFIKRVIGHPGDKIETRGGHPIINGWEVPHCYVGVYSYSEGAGGDPMAFNARHEGELFVEHLGKESYLTLFDRMSIGSSEYQGPYFVEPGQVFVMGDNRNNSHDSRMWFGGRGGGVPFANIKGRALFVWLSLAENSIDFRRIGTMVMGHPRLPANMQSLEGPLDKCLRERPPIEKTTPPPRGN